MVDISNIQKKNKSEEKKICSCWIPKRYLDLLEEKNIGFTDFVMAAFEETFGE